MTLIDHKNNSNNTWLYLVQNYPEKKDSKIILKYRNNDSLMDLKDILKRKITSTKKGT
jgi:hypothetical protein